MNEGQVIGEINTTILPTELPSQVYPLPGPPQHYGPPEHPSNGWNEKVKELAQEHNLKKAKARLVEKFQTKEKEKSFQFKNKSLNSQLNETRDAISLEITSTEQEIKLLQQKLRKLKAQLKALS